MNAAVYPVYLPCYHHLKMVATAMQWMDQASFVTMVRRQMHQLTKNSHHQTPEQSLMTMQLTLQWLLCWITPLRQSGLTVSLFYNYNFHISTKTIFTHTDLLLLAAQQNTEKLFVKFFKITKTYASINWNISSSMIDCIHQQ